MPYFPTTTTPTKSCSLLLKLCVPLQVTLSSCWTLGWASRRPFSSTWCLPWPATSAWSWESCLEVALPQTSSLQLQEGCFSTSAWLTWCVTSFFALDPLNLAHVETPTLNPITEKCYVWIWCLYFVCDKQTLCPTSFQRWTPLHRWRSGRPLSSSSSWSRMRGCFLASPSYWWSPCLPARSTLENEETNDGTWGSEREEALSLCQRVNESDVLHSIITINSDSFLKSFDVSTFRQ